MQLAVTLTPGPQAVESSRQILPAGQRTHGAPALQRALSQRSIAPGQADGAAPGAFRLDPACARSRHCRSPTRRTRLAAQPAANTIAIRRELQAFMTCVNDVRFTPRTVNHETGSVGVMSLFCSREVAR